MFTLSFVKGRKASGSCKCPLAAPPPSEIMAKQCVLFSNQLIFRIFFLHARVKTSRFHRAIICPRSTFFDATCRGDFKAGHTREINLSMIKSDTIPQDASSGRIELVQSLQGHPLPSTVNFVLVFPWPDTSARSCLHTFAWSPILLALQGLVQTSLNLTPEA